MTKYADLTPEQKAKKLEATRRWREANREKTRSYAKKYKEENADKIAAYREANKEKITIRAKEYREANKEKVQANRKKHRESAQHDPQRFINYLFELAKRGAKTRGIKFALTKEDIENLILDSKGKCALSGLPLSTMYNDPMKASIDRIDSNGCYTRDNVQLVGSMVNIAKNKHSMELFVEMCKGVVNVSNSSNH